MPAQASTLLPVELQEVSKAYGSTRVLDSINLTVTAGECLVLVGHNGAGKTTLMKLLLGLVRQTAGQIRVFGSNPAAGLTIAGRSALGYLPESIAFDEAMTGRELLTFYAGLKKVDKTACDELLARVGLEAAAERRLHTWSKGMRQRLGLAQAMLGAPQLLLLDEPTSGLDPALRHTLYEIIAGLRTEGVTVIIASHALTEVEEHADRIAILQQGKIIAGGTLAELNDQAALPLQIRISCKPGAAATIAASLEQQLGGQLDVRHTDDCRLQLACLNPDKMRILHAIARLDDMVTDCDIRASRLDEIYAHFIAGDQP